MYLRSTKIITNLVQRRTIPLISNKSPLSTSNLFARCLKSKTVFKESRLYTSKPPIGEHAKKLSTMISSPELIKAVKTEPKPSKLKELTKKYGAAGIMVYLAVGCVDLGITLGVIQLVGLEKVKVIEESVLDIVYSTGEKFGMKREEPKVDATNGTVTLSTDSDAPSFASVFILAYGIHKTLLLPVRLGITAAITPAIVRKLHQMGWTQYFPRLFGITKPKSS